MYAQLFRFIAVIFEQRTLDAGGHEVHLQIMRNWPKRGERGEKAGARVKHALTYVTCSLTRQFLRLAAFNSIGAARWTQSFIRTDIAKQVPGELFQMQMPMSCCPSFFRHLLDARTVRGRFKIYRIDVEKRLHISI